eukprot:1353645-Amphidinium_carterae.1
MELDDSGCDVLDAGEADAHDSNSDAQSDAEEEVWDLDWSSIEAQKAVATPQPVDADARRSLDGALEGIFSAVADGEGQLQDNS